MIAYRLQQAGWSVVTCCVYLGLLSGAGLVAQDLPATINVAQTVVSNPPDARSPLILKAVNDPQTGKGAFSFDGREDPPVIRARPGEDIRLTYTNGMSTHSGEHCIDGPCMNMTNLHFHGLHVSPDAPQDDVITMMAMPGQSLHYTVNIPLDQPPGLYWYHTHPHGESYQQDLDGMSGAIVIDGMERYVPELRGMREQILVLRDQVAEHERSRSLRATAQSSNPHNGMRYVDRGNGTCLYGERSGTAEDCDRSGRASVLAHCECFARQVYRLESGRRAA